MTNPILDDIELCHWVAEKLPIRFIGDPVLAVVCEPFTEEEFGGPEMHSLAERLIDTLTTYREHAGTGRGLAANQIGETRSMVAVWFKDVPEILVNPEVVSTDGMGEYYETCLSSGALIIGEVVRPWKGIFKYRDISGTKHTLEANEFETRVLLHEIDHLNGEHCMNKYEYGSVRFVTGGKEEVMSHKLKKTA